MRVLLAVAAITIAILVTLMSAQDNRPSCTNVTTSYIGPCK
jgi:hypothetical protein